MSEQVNHEDVKTVSADGVTVERELVCTDAGIEGTFTLESRREEPVAVRVVDELPEYFPVDEVAFEPGGAPDAGDITSGRVTVSQTVADEPVRLHYGIVPSEPVAEVRWSEPTVESVESADDDSQTGSVGPVADLEGLFGTEPADGDSPEDTGDSSTSNGTADGGAVDDETAEGDRPEDPADATTRIEPESGSQPEVGDATDGAGDGIEDADTGGEDTESAGDAGGDPESADDSENTEVDEASDDVGDSGAEGSDGTAGDAVDAPEGDAEMTESEAARHFEVRLDRLTARVEKFGAYASALEPFIDERGTGETALAGIEDDLVDLDRRLTAVREEVESAHENRERAVANLQDSVGDIDGALDDVEAAVETLEGEVDGLDRGLSTAEDDIDALEDRVEDHDDAIEATGDDVTDLEDRVDALETDLAALTETVGSVEDDLATLSETVESIEDELEGVHEEVETLHSFRRSLAQISNLEE